MYSCECVFVEFLCNKILHKKNSRKESSPNARLEADHHQLIMRPISKDYSNTFLERSFFYVAP